MCEFRYAEASFAELQVWFQVALIVGQSIVGPIVIGPMEGVVGECIVFNFCYPLKRTLTII